MSAVDELYEAIGKAKVRIGHQGGLRNSPKARQLWAKRSLHTDRRWERSQQRRFGSSAARRYSFNDGDHKVQVRVEGKRSNEVSWRQKPRLSAHVKRAVGLKPKALDFRRTSRRVIAAVERDSKRTGKRAYSFSGLSSKHDRIYARARQRNAAAGWKFRPAKRPNTTWLVRKSSTLYAAIAKAHALLA